MKNKSYKMIICAGLFMIMLAAASVSAYEDDQGEPLERIDIDYDDLEELVFEDEKNYSDDTSVDDDILIAPAPDDGLVHILSGDDAETQKETSDDKTDNTPILFAAGGIGIIGLTTAVLLIVKRH